MMYDTSWASLLRPGSADNFFSIGLDAGFEPSVPDFSTPAFSLQRAWWLSEFCRLVYRRCDEEVDTPVGFRDRNDFLGTVGLAERHFFNAGSVQAAVIEDLDARFGILVFRGTNCFENWLSNLNTFQSVWTRGGMVHQGFKQEFLRIWPLIRPILDEIEPPMIYTGHSLGGALATLAASKKPPRSVYTFGSPKVGDTAFALPLMEVPIFRITMPNDLVTTMPPSRIPFDFCHVGEWHPLPAAVTTHDAPETAMNGNGVNAFFARQWGRQLVAPPEFLSDHAPVNYSMRIAQEIKKRPNVPSEPAVSPLATIPT